MSIIHTITIQSKLSFRFWREGPLAAVFTNISMRLRHQPGCSPLTRSPPVCSPVCIPWMLLSPHYHHHQQQHPHPPQQQHPHNCARAVVRAGRGETRPLWRGQQGPCLGRWACAGHQASAGRFSDHPEGTGSQYRSWHLWTASQQGPWAGWEETLHSLRRKIIKASFKKWLK